MWRSDPHGPAVIVDPYSSGALIGPAFTEVGVPVVAVVTGPRPPDVYASSYRPADYSEIILAVGDHGAAVDRLRQLRPRCVLAGCESGVELAEAIAPLVVTDVANVPELAPARRHKGEMAAAVARSGLPVIEQICTDSPAEVARWLEASGLIGHDLVIKPPKSASSDGVTQVRGGYGWREVFDRHLGSVNRLGIRNDKLLIQEYVTGVEYVVDTFSYEGIHTVTDVCRYRKVGNGSHMAVYDSMDWLPPDAPEIDELTAYARGVLDAVGLRYGAAHVEVMLTPHGCRLIEVGARAHGGGQPRFCRLATGDSQVDRTVRYFGRLGALPLGYELRQHVRVVFLITRSAGTVHNADVLDEVRGLGSHVRSEVHLRNGDQVEPTKDLFGSLDLGFVVLAHGDPDQIEADYRTIRQLERSVRVEPVRVPAGPVKS